MYCDVMICYLTYIPTSYLTHLLTFYVAFLSDYILTLAFRCDKYSDALSDILSDIYFPAYYLALYSQFLSGIWTLEQADSPRSWQARCDSWVGASFLRWGNPHLVGKQHETTTIGPSGMVPHWVFFPHWSILVLVTQQVLDLHPTGIKFRTCLFDSIWAVL